MDSGRSKGRLQNLIPIAVVVTGGCESCAEKLVTQALAQGSSWQEIDETVRILADMQKRECVTKALGSEVVGRMEKPLAAARRVLQESRPQAAKAAGCGCGASVSGPA